MSALILESSRFQCASGGQSARRGATSRLSGSGLSLMPEGLESAISVEQMRDLIAFLLPSQ